LKPRGIKNPSISRTTTEPKHLYLPKLKEQMMLKPSIAKNSSPNVLSTTMMASLLTQYHFIVYEFTTFDEAATFIENWIKVEKHNAAASEFLSLTHFIGIHN
jgi:hypothetical protein